MWAEIDPIRELGDSIDRALSSADFPHVFGIGVSYRSTDGRVVASVEWDWIAYSDLIASANPRLDIAGLRLDDGSEINAGAEYVFLETTPLIGLRAGL